MIHFQFYIIHTNTFQFQLLSIKLYNVLPLRQLFSSSFPFIHIFFPTPKELHSMGMKKKISERIKKWEKCDWRELEKKRLMLTWKRPFRFVVTVRQKEITRFYTTSLVHFFSSFIFSVKTIRIFFFFHFFSSSFTAASLLLLSTTTKTIKLKFFFSS